VQLKTYQENALEQLDRWLDALKAARKDTAEAEEFYAHKKKPVPERLKNFPLSAWDTLKDQNVLPGIPQDGDIVIPACITRTATSGEPIPHVCLKVPTGGGKTLLGVAALERVKQETGFVLWIVPTKAIYEQTITAFRTREHPYRQMLEKISGGKVRLLQKSDRFTRQDVDSYLCVMMLMLPSANRQTGREFLKIFRDSGGYTSFFPEQDDATANATLSDCHRDLEKSDDGDWVKHSLINVLKLIRPTVILDEAHKAYGTNDKSNREFVQSVNRLNPRLVLELSATPKIGISNILVNISGADLQAEEMIKLPIEIHSFSNSDWKHTLAETQRKLNELGAEAEKLRARENRYVRPIALVRVQRTGGDQTQRGLIHAEHAREYLIRSLAVPENQIRIQSSEQKELAGEDLLSDLSTVRWIITKDALKEGWDCSFAYVLTLLDNTTATTAMTQMVGRVMRQPHARNIAQSDDLNRCYIYCYNQDVGEAAKNVKVGLEKEGLSGLGDAVCTHGDRNALEPVTVKRRKKYRRLNIFLPQVLHEEGAQWRPIDYDRDILGEIDWDALDVGEAVDLDDKDIRQEIRVTVSLRSNGEWSEKPVDTGESLSLDYFTRRLADVVPNPWQAARMAECFIQKHRGMCHSEPQLLNNRIWLSEVLRHRVKDALDSRAEEVFRDKVGQNVIRFHLESNRHLDYELSRSFEVFVSSREQSFHRKHGRPIQQSLFEPVYESALNVLERNFALYLEGSKAIHWWHKIAARQGYYLQGWRRQRVYPDFVACREGDGKLLILETKGVHLKGNEDTTYKAKLFEALEKTYRLALDRGTMQVNDPPAVFAMMIADTWEEQIGKLVR